MWSEEAAAAAVTAVGGMWVVGLWWTSGSLAIISKSVGLDRVLSGGGDIGFKRPAVRAELNLEKLEGKSWGWGWAWAWDGWWPLAVGEEWAKSIIGEKRPGEKRILWVEGDSGNAGC